MKALFASRKTASPRAIPPLKMARPLPDGCGTIPNLLDLRKSAPRHLWILHCRGSHESCDPQISQIGADRSCEETLSPKAAPSILASVASVFSVVFVAVSSPQRAPRTQRECPCRGANGSVLAPLESCAAVRPDRTILLHDGPQHNVFPTVLLRDARHHESFTTED